MPRGVRNGRNGHLALIFYTTAKSYSLSENATFWNFLRVLGNMYGYIRLWGGKFNCKNDPNGDPLISAFSWTFYH